jgi:hypothetical protein
VENLRIHENIQGKTLFLQNFFVANTAFALFFMEKSVEIVDNFMQSMVVEKLSNSQKQGFCPDKVR